MKYVYFITIDREAILEDSDKFIGRDDFEKISYCINSIIDSKQCYYIADEDDPRIDYIAVCDGDYQVESKYIKESKCIGTLEEYQVIKEKIEYVENEMKNAMKGFLFEFAEDKYDEISKKLQTTLKNTLKHL